MGGGVFMAILGALVLTSDYADRSVAAWGGIALIAGGVLMALVDLAGDAAVRIARARHEEER